MTTTSVGAHEETFRSAIEGGDFVRAEAALQEYIVWFQTAARTPEDVARGRDLFVWGIRLAKARAAQVSKELARLTNVMNGYGPAARNHTWRLDA